MKYDKVHIDIPLSVELPSTARNFANPNKLKLDFGNKVIVNLKERKVYLDIHDSKIVASVNNIVNVSINCTYNKDEIGDLREIILKDTKGVFKKGVLIDYDINKCKIGSTDYTGVFKKTFTNL